MNLEKWEEDDKNLTEEYTERSFNKFAKGKSIDLFYDLCPEYKDLRHCSYSYVPPPGYLQKMLR